MIQIADLPEEVLIIIFKHFSTADLVNTICEVCKRWKRITHDSTFHRRLVIDQKIDQRVVLNLLKENKKRIAFVELKRRNDVNRILPLVAVCPNLLGLKIISCQGQTRKIDDLNNAVNVKLIWQVLSNCKHFRMLEIRKTTFKNGMRNFCPDNVKLHWLRIKSNNDLEIAERRLEQLTHLQDLRLQGVKLYNDRALIRIFLNNANTLTVLKLDIWRLPIVETPEDELMRFIARCSNLTKLNLQNHPINGLTDIGFSYLANLKRIKSLVVTNAKKVSAHAIIGLFCQPHMRHLEALNLGGSPQLHQLVLKFIVDRCPNLRKLSLDQFGVGCPCIGVIDLKYIGDRCTRLQRLELNSMGPEVGHSLPSILKRYPNLRSFKYYVRPLKDYLSEYRSVLQRAREELSAFHMTCSVSHGIRGYLT